MRIFFIIVLGTLLGTILNWLVKFGFPPNLSVVHKTSLIIPLVCNGIMLVIFIMAEVEARRKK